MRLAKDFPVTILQALKPFVEENNNSLFRQVSTDSSLLKFVDNNFGGSFHFTIEKYSKQPNNKFELDISHAPWSEQDNEEGRATVELQALRPQFNYWINLLKAYEALRHVVEDPILAAYEKEFLVEFTIAKDENANSEPLDLRKQILLDNTLTAIRGLLEEKKLAQNAPEIDAIQQEISLLQLEQGGLSKRAVAVRFARILAKIRKGGFQLLKWVVTEAGKEFVKVLAKDGATKMLENLS